MKEPGKALRCQEARERFQGHRRYLPHSTHANARANTHTHTQFKKKKFPKNLQLLNGTKLNVNLKFAR